MEFRQFLCQCQCDMRSTHGQTPREFGTFSFRLLSNFKWKCGPRAELAAWPLPFALARPFRLRLVLVLVSGVTATVAAPHSGGPMKRA